MRFVYDLILYVFEFLISFAYFGRMYDKKLKSNRSVFAVGIPLFVGVSVIYNLFSNVVLNLLLFFLVNLIFAKICFNASIKNAIIHSISLDARPLQLILTTRCCGGALIAGVGIWVLAD